jgi:hypothetical protein
VFSDDPTWALAPWRVAKNESGAVIRRAARVYAMSVEKRCPPTGIAKLVQYLMQRILVREVFDDFFPIRNCWPERKRASLPSESVEARQSMICHLDSVRFRDGSSRNRTVWQSMKC